VSAQGKAAARETRKNLRKTGGPETEIKLRLADRPGMLRKLKSLKATGGRRVHEMNTLYDTPEGSLAREGKLVRIRVEELAPATAQGKKYAARAVSPAKRRAVLTYKGPALDEGHAPTADGQRYKVREEHEVFVEDGVALASVFERMGLRPCFRYEKYRSTYRLPHLSGLVVELDETPIGDFLEVEGDAASIDRAAALLGFAPADYITKSYGLLFLEERQSAASRGEELPPAEMLFPSA
jgi:adenylate cyclase class 2